MIYIPPWQMRVKTVRAGDLPVGSVVKLMEGGTAVDYLVVNQGIPSNSDLYDASCNGTWLLRKDIHSEREWDSGSGDDAYKTSTINTWLNGDFFNSLGSIEQSTIKQIQIPYYSLSLGNPILNLTCKVFLLGGYEVGWTNSTKQYLPVDGDCLSYFNDTASTDSKRIAYLNNSATGWWLRSLNINNSRSMWSVSTTGGTYVGLKAELIGVRPALILPSTAKFDSTTLILKG